MVQKFPTQLVSNFPSLRRVPIELEMNWLLRAKDTFRAKEEENKGTIVVMELFYLKLEPCGLRSHLFPPSILFSPLFFLHFH